MKGGTTTPTGTINFMNGSALIGTGTLNASGLATLSTSSLAAGWHSLSAQYSGNVNHLASYSAGASMTVAQVPTTTTLKASTTTPTSGSSVTLTATVKSNGIAPAGMVDFVNGGTLLGT